MMRTLFLSFLVITLAGCEIQAKETEFYSAEEDPCNTTCGFNYESLKGCYSKAAVEEYAKQALIPFLNIASSALANSNQGACICATAVLSSEGTLSQAKILKTNDKVAANKLIGILKTYSMPRVPDGALCITENGFNEIPISLRK